MQIMVKLYTWFIQAWLCKIQGLLKTYTTVFKDYKSMKHTESNIKSSFANDGLIERINKYQKISIKLLSLYLVQHYAAPNKGTILILY